MGNPGLIACNRVDDHALTHRTLYLLARLLGNRLFAFKKRGVKG